MPLSINISDYISGSRESLGGMVLHNRRQFSIPYNQRPWSWRRADIDELWGDINGTVLRFYEADWNERPKPIGNPHFMGAFVFVKGGTDNEWQVVDGQQRLTAIIMFMAALREAAHQVSEQTGDANIKTDADVLVFQYTKWLEADPLPGEERSRLAVDKEYEQIFVNYIVKPRDQKTRTKLFSSLGIDLSEKKDHKRLKDSFDYVRSLVTDKLQGLSEKEVVRQLTALLDTVQGGLLCLWAAVEEESFAFEVFKCLNARGLELGEADKIKNELFIQAKQSLHKNISARWSEIYKNVPHGNIAVFLRTRHMAFVGPCPEKSLYKEVKEKQIDTSKIDDLTKEWVTDSEIIKVVTLQCGAGLKDETIEILKSFQVLGISLSAIFLLSAGKRYLPSDEQSFRKAALLCRNFCFRLLTICGEDTPVLEKALGKAARDLADGKGLEDILPIFKHYNSDSEFETEFSRKTEKRVKVQYYILFELEKYLGGGSGLVPAPHSPNQNIEHIMPKKFSKAASRMHEWGFARGNDKHKDYLNRLGNLCLLEGDINRDVSNFDFAAKQTAAYPGIAKNVKDKIKGGTRPRKSYKDSVLKLPGDLIDTKKYSKWDFEEIDKRQQYLATLALKVWKLDI